MKSLRVFMIVFVLVIFLACSKYPEITGKVVDNATGKPIEGALVVAQWTKKHGFGLTYHTLSKITETQTDKNGGFTLTGIKDLFVEPPEMIIYKEGYIPWRNDMIFPGGKDSLTKSHEWNNNVTYKLKIISESLEIVQLSDFLEHGMLGIHNKEVPITRDLTRKLSSQKYDEIRKYELRGK